MNSSLNIALHFLKFRPRSVFEIKQKLKSKKITDDEIKKTIAVLLENKLLDDKEFARMWVKDRNNFKPSGTYLLKMELRKFGINDDLIEEVLANQDEEKLAREAITSKSRFDSAGFQKKAGFLQRRGFKTDVIIKVLKN
jgi:regulatory protein